MNAESEDDEGYSSIAGCDPSKNGKFNCKVIKCFVHVHFLPFSFINYLIYSKISILFFLIVGNVIVIHPEIQRYFFLRLP